MKAKKLRKVILSFALSAAMLAEPLVSMPIVYAEEVQKTETTTEQESTDDISMGNSETPEGNDNQNEFGSSDTSTDSGKDDTKEEDGSQNQNGSEEENGGSDENNTGEGNENPDESNTGEENENPDENNTGEENENPDENNTEEENADSGEALDEETDGEEIPDKETEENEEKLEEKEKKEEEKKKEDLDGFSDMPSDYKLTSFMEDLKADLPNSLNSVSESDEGETYAEREVITFAGSLEEAEMIAEAYHAEIVSFNMGVLTLKLGADKNVKSAMRVASDMANSLPPVWPNYYRYLYEETAPGTDEMSPDLETNPETDGLNPELEIVEEEYYIEDEGSTQETDEEGIPSLAEYEQTLNEMDGYKDLFLQPTDGSYQWFHTTIGSPYAWDAGYTGSGVKVGVVDSGIDSNADLDANVFGEKDFCDGSSSVTDSEGHGTHVAGIIAALANNSKGVGVAPNAKVFDAKVFGTGKASGTDATIIAAIAYLIGEENNTNSSSISSTAPRVDIINMSLGGPGGNPAFQSILNKAYEKGVVVFASTGNDGGSLMMYPASYNHVIAVAATDTNNQRAYFSNYGSVTDLSAPGVNIWSTIGSGSDYKSMQGTSMACPVAAGEAAVILSGQNTLSALQNKSGKARVNAVESIMKGNTISAGSGMGKGITSLTKVFKLSTAAAKPNAPAITITPAADKQSVSVKIEAQAGMKLCYTTNGKNPVYKNEAADANTTFVDGNTVTFSLDCSQKAKGTVKALAINASGAIGAVKSKTYTLSPYVTDIKISGPIKVEKGKTISLAAAITPTYATNKKVTWELKTSADAAVDTAKIKIDQKGKVTATAKADAGKYKVIVTAQDSGRKSVTYQIEVVEAGTAVQSLAFAKNTTKELWITKTTANPTLQLTQSLTAKEKNAEGKLVEIDRSKFKDCIVWSSSKPAIAEVNSQTGVVTAKAAGTTTITAKANDNGNKKATINITVKQGVTGITITDSQGKNTNLTLAAGKSMTLKAAITPKKPTNKKIKWSISPDDSAVNINPKKPTVSINASNGKITTKAGAPAGTYTVTATAADGKGAVATQKVKIYSGAIGGIKLDATKTTLYTKKIDEEKTNTKIIKATITGVKGSTDFDPNAYKVTSSNESIVKATVQSSTGGVITITLTSTGNMYGKANVVVASTDGSNKKATCVVTVSGGITKTEIKNSAKTAKVSKLTLFRAGTNAVSPSTATLYAVITGSAGANVNAYDVTSSNPALVKTSLNKTTGAVTLTASSKSTGKATITLKATDGSKKKATCTVTVCNPPSRINIAPKGGNNNYVAKGKSLSLQATLETEYGAVSNKSVTWKIYDDSNGQEATAKSHGVSINSSGKVTVSKSAALGNYTVKATAKDGSGVNASYTIRATEGISSIFVLNGSEPLSTKKTWLLGKNYFATLPISWKSKDGTYSGSFAVTSSNPKVMSGTIVYVEGYPCLRVFGGNTGTATITLKALDGSGKQVKYKFKVVK